MGRLRFSGQVLTQGPCASSTAGTRQRGELTSGNLDSGHVYLQLLTLAHAFSFPELQADFTFSKVGILMVSFCKSREPL